MFASQQTLLTAAVRPPKASKTNNNNIIQNSSYCMTNSSSSSLSSASRSLSLPQNSLAIHESSSPTAAASSPISSPPPTTYFCYLLRSDSPKHPGSTYIGFTTNPIRRLRQHNGDLTAGAWRTSRKRPWSMICCVYGFTSKVSALQFEWQWTYPKKSRRLKVLMSSGRRWTSGTRGKIELLYALLTSSPWKNFPLHIRYTTQINYSDWHLLIMKRSERELLAFNKSMSLIEEEKKELKKLSHHIYELPSHIDISAGTLNELEMYRYINENKGKRGRKKLLTNNTETTLSVSDSEENSLIEGIDENEIVSGEESHDSQEEDLIEPGWEETNLENNENDNNNNNNNEIINVNNSNYEFQPGLSQSFTPRHPCNICHNSLTLNARTRTFFTCCPHCNNTSHLTCAATHIIQSLQPSSSSTSTNDQSPSSSSSSIEFPKTLPVSPFISMPSSLPLIPPPSTGFCPSCGKSWNWPVLVDRCRSMYANAKGQRGGDVFYDAATSTSMAKLMREFAGKNEGIKNKKEKKSKNANENETETPKTFELSTNKQTTKRKRKSPSSTTISESKLVDDNNLLSSSSLSQPVLRTISHTPQRRVEMFDGFQSSSLTSPPASSSPSSFSMSQQTPTRAENDTIETSLLSPASIKRSLIAEAASKRLGLFSNSSISSLINEEKKLLLNKAETKSMPPVDDTSDVMIVSHTQKNTNKKNYSSSSAFLSDKELFTVNEIDIISDSEEEINNDEKENIINVYDVGNINNNNSNSDKIIDDDEVQILSLRERLERRNK